MNKAYKVKKSNAPKSSKKTSTNDRSNSNKKNKSSKKMTNKKNQNEQIVQTIKEEIKDKLTLLKEKTLSLQSNLNQIKQDIDIERNNSIQDSHNLNEKLKEINNEINRLSVDNKYLTNNLSSFEKKLIEEINKNIIKRGKKGIKNENDEERLNKNIKLNDKMILNNKINLELLQREKNYLENEIKVNGVPDKKEKLEKKLDGLKSTQKNIMKEIEELKIIKIEHNKICAKKLSELLKQYDIIKTDLNFEKKKHEINTINNNLKTNSPNKSRKILKTESNENNQSVDNQNNSEKQNNNRVSNFKKKFNNKNSKSKNIFNYYFKQLSENKKRKENLSNKDYAFINENNFSSYPNVNSASNLINSNNEANNSAIINMKLNNSTMNNKNFNKNSVSNQTLFTKSEKTILSKLIPDNCLDNYEKKFNSLINENLNIKTKMNDNLKQKKINKTNNILKLEYSDMQNEIIYKKKLILNTKLNEYNKKKRDIIEKIKLNEKYMKYNEIIYNNKNHENERLLKDYRKIYEEIKNGKLCLKKGAALTPANIQAMDKWGMRGSNNTSVDDINEDVDYANVSEYENEENEEGNGEGNEEENEEENDEGNEEEKDQTEK